MAMNPFSALGYVLQSVADPTYPEQVRQTHFDEGQQQALGNLRAEELAMRKQERAQQMRMLQQERQRQEMMQKALGGIAPVLAQRTGLPQEQLGALINSGADLGTLGKLSQLMAPPEPTKLQEQLQTLQVLSQLPPEQRDAYKSLFGRGGTTVNVGGTQDAFQEKFVETLGKGLADQVVTLGKEAEDTLAQATGSEQALNILSANPDLDISPTAAISNQAKSLFAPFLSEDQLEDVADFQTLESQLIRNRFDVTKVLKGAITEQEQQAAQQVAGRATGTRGGLEKTLANNIAFATLQADEKQRRAEYIKQMGENYSPSKFKDYYKTLGETGQRPTLDGILSEINQRYGIGKEAPQGIDPKDFEFMTPEERALFQ